MVAMYVARTKRAPCTASSTLRMNADLGCTVGASACRLQSEVRCQVHVEVVRWREGAVGRVKLVIAEPR